MRRQPCSTYEDKVAWLRKQEKRLRAVTTLPETKALLRGLADEMVGAGLYRETTVVYDRLKTIVDILTCLGLVKYSTRELYYGHQKVSARQGKA